MINFREFKRLTSVMILTFCTIFICTIFVNRMIDLSAINFIDLEDRVLYEAQLSMSKVVTSCAGGMLGAITLIILIFSIARYIEDNSAVLGVLKAMGYSQWRCALSFIKFAFAILVSSCLAYISAAFLAHLFYDPLPQIQAKFNFHIQTVLIVIVLPSILFGLISVLYAKHLLKKKPIELINSQHKIKIGAITKKSNKKSKNLPFLKELRKTVTLNNLVLIFFVGFASLAFSTQIQMAISIIDYIKNNYTAPIVLTSLGLVLGISTLLISLSLVINTNKKHIAILSAFGYTKKECVRAMLGGYRIVAYIGFILGTIYKYVLMFILIESFAGEGAVVTFNFIGFFTTLALFILFYEIIMLMYNKRIAKIPLKEIMEA